MTNQVTLRISSSWNYCFGRHS